MSEQNNDFQGKKEVDFLVYKGNAVPKFLRFVWTVFAVFMFYYLFFEWDNISQTSFLKDLSNWLTKAKG